MTSFLHLPPELLEQIILLLAEEKPLSTRLLHEEPSDALLRSDDHPLKNLSETCHMVRELCFPSLYSAVKVDIKDAVKFLRFSESHGLAGLVDSVVLYLHPGSAVGNFISCNIWPSMVRVVDLAKPSVVTVLLPTLLFQEILPYELNLTHQWAFRIPCQVLQLGMPRDLAALSQTSRAALDSRNLFQIRNWTHCTFNQGSSINGYSTYEYFLKTAPSIFNSLDIVEFGWMMKCAGFADLTSLDYVAIFPINHMQRFYQCMQVMMKLKRLRVQFAPTPSNNVLDNPAAVGKCQPGDLWLEFEECYKSLAEFIRLMWDNKSIPLEEFICLDYVNPSLRELLDRVMGRCLQHFRCFRSDSDGVRWVRNDESLQVLDQ